MALTPQRLVILVYHRVLPDQDPLSPDEMWADVFEAHVRALTRFFNILPLCDAVDRLAAGTLPSRAVSITFDDGYADNYTRALPLLEKYGATATFFVATGYLDGGRMWNDTLIEAVRGSRLQALDLDAMALGQWSLGTVAQRRQTIEGLLGRLKYLEPDQRAEQVDKVAGILGARLPDDLMMSSDQVRALSDRGMAIGGHTVNHPILASLDDQKALAEIRNGRDTLQSIVDGPVDAFAYPNGKPGRDYTRRDVSLVREAGFRVAVTTGWGCAGRGSDPLQLGRIGPWDRSGVKLSLRLMRSYFGAEADAA